MTHERMHPRDETPEQRAQAYKALNKVIRRRLTQHGTVMERPRFTLRGLLNGFENDKSTLLIATLQTADRVEMDLTLVRGFDQVVGNYALTAVTVMHDANVQGARTEYSSLNHQPFTRIDHGPSELPITQDSPILLQVISGAMQAYRKHEDIDAGLDGHPIAALEASTVTTAIADAEYIRHN